MTKTFKLLAVMAALAVATALGSAVATADSINFSGAITLQQGGTGCASVSPCQSLSFSSLLISSPGDTLNGSSVTLSGMVDFISATGAQFQNNPDTISLGGGSLGSLTGDINFIDITGGGSNGMASYTMTVDLSNLTVTPGSSTILSQWAAANVTNGNGLLTFQFAGSSVTNSLTSLLNNTGSLNSTVSGSIDAPEPGSLTLLGIGLIGIGLVLRRRSRAVAS